MHCSLELFWMMRGYAVEDGTTFTRGAHERWVNRTMCGIEPNPSGEGTVWGRWWRGSERGWGPHEADVTCQNCLVTMDAALEQA